MTSIHYLKFPLPEISADSVQTPSPVGGVSGQSLRHILPTEQKIQQILGIAPQFSTRDLII